MSYLALETCAVAGLVVSIILVFVVADLNQRIADMRQTLDSLKSKAYEQEHKRWRARRDDEISPGGKTLAELNREWDEEQERLAMSEKQHLAVEEKERQRMRPSLAWRLGRFVRLWRTGQ